MQADYRFLIVPRICLFGQARRLLNKVLCLHSLASVTATTSLCVWISMCLDCQLKRRSSFIILRHSCTQALCWCSGSWPRSHWCPTLLLNQTSLPWRYAMICSWTQKAWSWFNIFTFVDVFQAFHWIPGPLQIGKHWQDTVKCMVTAENKLNFVESTRIRFS